MTTLDDLDWPRRTARLELARMTPADADAVWSYRRTRDVAYWIGTFPADEAHFDERFRDADHLADQLVVRLDGQVVGDLMVEVEDGWGQRSVAARAARSQARLGWTFAPEHQGRGLATEAVADLLALCFDGLGVRRVVAEAFADNTASWRLMERLGMRREGHARADSLHAELGWLDGMTYAILADEWRSAGSPPRS